MGGRQLCRFSTSNWTTKQPAAVVQITVSQHPVRPSTWMGAMDLRIRSKRILRIAAIRLMKAALPPQHGDIIAIEIQICSTRQNADLRLAKAATQPDAEAMTGGVRPRPSGEGGQEDFKATDPA